MKKLILKNRWFLLSYSIFFTTCIILLSIYSKPDLHILLNKANAPFFDFFFKNITHLGDGTMIGVLGVVFLFIKFRSAIAFLLGSIPAAIVVNIFKKVLTHDMYRPSKYFELFESYKLHLVEGVKLHSLQSFPSGHTATAFSVFLMLALVTKSNVGKLLLFFGAVVVAYSRVYISQHFMEDITVGSIISVVLMLAAFYWVQRWHKPWLDNSVLTTHTQSK
ncbi:PAP2 superfamily protein [Mariniphaga anaerophila]|uniref:PAP2 superfamily protein n=1 Tax=Mariniphaga anaerophila TaxID=1484053 RepID=A0A1M4W0T5_9BACT|nr:phosphatase PAP2 family protein [Mariniphaga anaerophila]SHE74755.1 PAP2 superfamily protein [Mariniphaga anaerophila]